MNCVFLCGKEVTEKFGIPVSFVMRYIPKTKICFSEEDILKIVDNLRKKGWEPGRKKCPACGEWKDKDSFYPMEGVCKFCRVGRFQRENE